MLVSEIHPDDVGTLGTTGQKLSYNRRQRDEPSPSGGFMTVSYRAQYEFKTTEEHS